MTASFSASSASADALPGHLHGAAALLPVTDPVAGPWALTAALLFITFVLHLLLMNALLGLALLTLAERLFSAKPGLSRESDLLLPKAVALTVNLGIPPFLFLQSIYGQFLYPSSILIGLWWLSLMALVMLAYYGFYINMSRPGLPGPARSTALALACLLLLIVAFIFVNNMTLLQTPANWALYARQAGGVLLNLTEPQLAPRYLHVILASLAVGGLCRAFLATMTLREAAPDSPEARAAKLCRAGGLNIFFWVSLAQILAGGGFFLSLPSEMSAIFTGGDSLATALFGLSLLLLLPAALFLARKRRLGSTALAAGLIIICMAGMRSLLRAAYLRDIYDPPLRAMDWPPFLIFAGSLALAVPLLIWMLRLYFRYSGTAYSRTSPDMVLEKIPGLPLAGVAQDAPPRSRERTLAPSLPPTAPTVEEKRDALLINETARAPGDDVAPGRPHDAPHASPYDVAPGRPHDTPRDSLCDAVCNASPEAGDNAPHDAAHKGAHQDRQAGEDS